MLYGKGLTDIKIFEHCRIKIQKQMYMAILLNKKKNHKVYGYKIISTKMFEIHCISRNENSWYEKMMHTKNVKVYKMKKKPKTTKHFKYCIFTNESKMLSKNVRPLMTFLTFT